MKMEREEILAGLKDIVASADESLRDRLGGITESTRVLEDLGFTSISLLFMAISIEETFHVELKDVDIWKLSTMGDVVSMIRERMR